MKKVTLTRTSMSDQGTFGVLSVDEHAWFTGELPDRGNANDVSCIPLGTYPCSYTLSFRMRKRTYEVGNVPGRSGIRIHSANFMGDKAKGLHCQLNGCVALGKKLGTMDGQQAVLLSVQAVREFEEYMGKKPFVLEVVDGMAREDR